MEAFSSLNPHIYSIASVAVPLLYPSIPSHCLWKSYSFNLPFIPAVPPPPFLTSISGGFHTIQVTYCSSISVGFHTLRKLALTLSNSSLFSPIWDYCSQVLALYLVWCSINDNHISSSTGEYPYSFYFVLLVSIIFQILTSLILFQYFSHLRGQYFLLSYVIPLFPSFGVTHGQFTASTVWDLIEPCDFDIISYYLPTPNVHLKFPSEPTFVYPHVYMFPFPTCTHKHSEVNQGPKFW